MATAEIIDNYGDGKYLVRFQPPTDYVDKERERLAARLTEIDGLLGKAQAYYDLSDTKLRYYEAVYDLLIQKNDHITSCMIDVAVAEIEIDRAQEAVTTADETIKKSTSELVSEENDLFQQDWLRNTALLALSEAQAGGDPNAIAAAQKVVDDLNVLINNINYKIVYYTDMMDGARLDLARAKARRIDAERALVTAKEALAAAYGQEPTGKPEKIKKDREDAEKQLAGASMALQKGKARRLAVQKNIDRLDKYAPDPIETTAFCVNGNADLSGVVGVFAIDGLYTPAEPEIYIAPDGIETTGQFYSPLSMSPAAMFLNFAMAPLRMTLYPGFRVGTMLSLPDAGFASVQVESYDYTCPISGEKTTIPGSTCEQTPIFYSGEFKEEVLRIGDSVAVSFGYANRGWPAVIGKLEPFAWVVGYVRFDTQYTPPPFLQPGLDLYGQPTGLTPRAANPASASNIGGTTVFSTSIGPEMVEIGDHPSGGTWGGYHSDYSYYVGRQHVAVGGIEVYVSAPFDPALGPFHSNDNPFIDGQTIDNLSAYMAAYNQSYGTPVTNINADLFNPTTSPITVRGKQSGARVDIPSGVSSYLITQGPTQFMDGEDLILVEPI
ncbi:MAG: hypothetical protein HQL74_07260 [Magnetococcales bacterium]|nr:hypothetical protein [Magnetococcales bacterium]